MATRARFHELTVAAIDRLTDDAVAVTFTVPAELSDAYAHRAGQHVAVVAPQLDDGVRRSYSVCTPAGSGVLRIGVKLLPGGGFSGYAGDRLRVGDVLEVLTPIGRFGPRELDAGAGDTPGHSYGLVAAGSGITPLLSIAATVLEHEPHSRISLVYANRAARTVMFAEELADLKDRYPDRLQVVHVLSREPGRVELLSGRLDGTRFARVLDGLVPPETVDAWYLCGPHAMVVELRDVLLGCRVDPAHVHTELFHADPVDPVDKSRGGASGAEVEVVLDGRRSTVRVPPDGVPILDATLAVRDDAPFSCRGGVCGTCRARLVEGSVRMDHRYALEDDEVAAGYVLACQSHPTSPRVVLDFDV